MVLVAPKSSRIKKAQFFPVIAEQLTHAGIVKQKTAVFIDDVEAGRAVLENIEKLALAIGKLRGVQCLPAQGDAPVVGHSGPEDDFAEKRS